MPPGNPDGKEDLPPGMTPEEFAALENHFAAVSREFQAQRNDVHNRQLITVDRMRKALNVSTEIITDPSVARRLATRHNAHVRTHEIARDMFLAYAGTPVERAAAMENLELQRLVAKEDGVFVFPYPDELEERRICAAYPGGSKEYLVVEASGSHYKHGHMRYGAPRPAADAQFRLPEARYEATPVFSIPDIARRPVADAITNPKILERILERPQAVAQLDDIATDPEMAKMGLAWNAIDAGLRHIVEVLNPQRGDHAIEYVVAEIVSIRGMILKEGNHELFFNDEIPGTSIMNNRSWVVLDHFNNDYVKSFDDAWTLQNREIPVEGHSHVKSLIANWYVKAARIKR